MPSPSPVPARTRRAAALCLAGLLAGLLATAAPAWADDGQLRVDHYGMDEGLVQGTVADIAQDADGYLWLATFGGLQRFTGNRFDDAPGSPGQVAQLARTTTVLADGPGLWVGVQGQGLWRWEAGSYQQVDQPLPLARAVPSDLRPDGAGGLLVASTAGLFHRSAAGSWTTLHEGPCSQLQGTPEGELSFISRRQLFSLAADGTRRLLVDRSVETHWRDPAGGLWWLDNQGLALRGADGVIHRLPLGSRRDAQAALVLDGTGQLWAVRNTTLVLLGPWSAARTALEADRLVPVHTLDLGWPVASVHPAEDGSLWVGTAGGGLRHVSAQPFESHHLHEKGGDALPGPVVSAGRDTWAIAGCNTLQQFRDGKPQDAVMLNIPVDATGCISAIGALPGGRLVVGGGVLFVHDGVASRPVPVVPPIAEGDQVSMLRVDPTGALEVGLQSGRLLGGTADAGLRDLPVPAELGRIFARAQRGEERVLGTETGLWIEADGQWRQVTGEAGFAWGPVRAAHVDQTGVIWGATDGGGLGFLTERGAGRLDPVAHGFGDRFLSAILPDGSDGLWIQGNQGLHRLALRELWRVVDGKPGRLGVETVDLGEANGWVRPSMDAAPDGTLWLSTIDHLVSFDSRQPLPSQQAGVVKIDHIGTLARQRALPEAAVTLDADDGRDVQIEYSSPVLSPSQRARFQWRLVPGGRPVDAVPFGPPTSRSSVRLVDLAPGTHRFQVRAVGANGAPGPLRELRLLVPYRWFELWPLRLVGALVLVGLAVWAFRRRLRAVQEQNHQLQSEIDQRIAADLRLQQQKRYYQGLFDAAGCGLLLFDGDGRCLDANPEACRLFSSSLEALLEQSPASLGVARPESPPAQTTCTRPDLSTFPARLDWAPFTVGGQERMLVSIIDLTALSRVQEDRDQLESALQSARRIEALGRLTGGVAHDMKNVITAILGNVELMFETELGQDPEAAECLDHIRASAEQGTRLTRRLLALGRPRSGDREVFEADTVLRELQPLLGQLLPEDIRLDIQHGAPGLLRMVRAELEQVVLNLVVNAGHAMPRGGCITVRSFRFGPWVCVEVSDEGEGMSEELQARIFDPYFTTREGESGTGLGLATVQTIVSRAGGSISVQSSPGMGATFEIRLPAATGHQPAAPSPPATAPRLRLARPPASGEMVLVVDDDDAVRITMVRVLQRAGYAVVDFGDPERVAEWMAEHGHEVDLVVSDVVMPGMGGPQLVALLQSMEPGLPALLVSGHDDSALADRGVDPALHAVLAKPFAPDALLARVAAALAERRPPHLWDGLA